MAADEDKILFGSSNALIADEFYNQIDAALVQGVASLPLMNDKGGSGDDTDAAEESRDQKMLRLLRAPYTKYVDLMELYGDRNIFTVANRTAHFRKRIVEAFQAEQDDNNNNNEDVDEAKQQGHEEESTEQKDADTTAANGDASQKNSEEDARNTATTDDTPKPPPAMPKSVDEIPTPEDMASLQEQIKVLRTKLKQARQKRAEEEQRCKELEEKANFAQESNQTIAKVAVEIETAVPAAVNAMLEGRQHLEQSQQQGNKLLQKMDDLKNNKRALEEDGENDPDELLAQHMARAQRNKRAKTLEDQYCEDRGVLEETQIQDLKDIKQMLQRKS